MPGRKLPAPPKPIINSKVYACVRALHFRFTLLPFASQFVTKSFVINRISYHSSSRLHSHRARPTVRPHLFVYSNFCVGSWHSRLEKHASCHATAPLCSVRSEHVPDIFQVSARNTAAQVYAPKRIISAFGIARVRYLCLCITRRANSFGSYGYGGDYSYLSLMGMPRTACAERRRERERVNLNYLAIDVGNCRNE